MDRPQRIRWLLFAGVVALFAVALAVVVLTGERRTPAPSPAPAAAPPPPAPPVLAVPPPQTVLRRGDLATAAAKAAAAYAAGEAVPAEVKALANRRFEAVIPFGCAGPGQGGGPARWDLDVKRRAITLTAQPRVWTEAAWVKALPAADQIEGVEGFWMPRPWATAESCPQARTAQAGDAPAVAEEQTLGLAQVFGGEASRLTRREGQAYETVLKISDGDLSSAAREFRLVLSGRVATFSSGAPIACHAVNIDQRPPCLFAVEIERVAFVDPGSGQVLAEWRY